MSAGTVERPVAYPADPVSVARHAAAHVRDESARDWLADWLATAAAVLNAIGEGLTAASTDIDTPLSSALSANHTLAAVALNDFHAAITGGDIWMSAQDAHDLAEYKRLRALETAEVVRCYTDAQVEDLKTAEFIRGYRSHLNSGPRP